ncbi:hypothetical protein [Microcoleus sp. BROC3]|uniref:hypothetical protein n=1 Tax=Microcoleus sp. BROC3 TaxID=3055323 RepID=UPI002FD4CA18
MFAASQRAGISSGSRLSILAVKLVLMNKALLRQLQPLLRNFTPHNTRKLIRAFEVVATTAGKKKELLAEGLTAFLRHTASSLKKQGVPQHQISQEIARIGVVALAWMEKWVALWATFFSPAILLALCLAPTLDTNLVPERRDLTFEEIKESLLDRHWPPQRQRCDFVAASAY